MVILTRMISRCRCGGVKLEARGAPIVSAVCYCADCQNGSRQIEHLPGAGAVRDPDGGTSYILFRKDRIACVAGDALLQSHKIKAGSATNRVVATCCNAAMFLNFDKGPFWVSAYRARFEGEIPALQMRICTRSMPSGVALQAGAPSYPGYPKKLLMKLLTSGLAMWLRR